MHPLLLFLFLFTQVCFSQNKAANDWQLKKFENGIAVYSRLTENSKFKELKSVYEVKTSLCSIVALLNDFESYTQWVYRCGVSSTTRKLAENEFLHYQSVVAPWPVENRDFMVKVHLAQDPKTKVIVQNVVCLPDAVPRVKGHIRILHFNAKWTITPLKNGSVSVEYQLLVDPGGSVPAWLVNLAAVDGPFETALNMKEWVLKEKYQKASVSYIKEP